MGLSYIFRDALQAIYLLKIVNKNVLYVILTKYEKSIKILLSKYSSFSISDVETYKVHVSNLSYQQIW